MTVEDICWSHNTFHTCNNQNFNFCALPTLATSAKFHFSTFNYNEKPMSCPLLQLLRVFKYYSWKRFWNLYFNQFLRNLIFECGIRHSDACNVTKLIVMSSYSACWYIKMFSICDLEYIYQCTLLKSSRFNYQIHV